jgi:Sporulation and spore germination
MSWRRRTVVALALGVGAVACGLGTQQEASVFRADQVPPGILDRTLTPSTTSGAPTTTIAPLVAYRIFLVRAGAIVEVLRASNTSTTPAGAIDVLGQGPTTAESLAGFRSALGSANVVASVRTNGALASVDLARSFAEIARQDQILAIGQITLTLTDRPDVLRVVFTMANVTIDVPKGNGSLTHEPVGADDFRELLRLPSSTPTTTTTVAASGASGPVSTTTSTTR